MIVSHAGLPRDAHVTVVRTGGLGDTILVLPTLEILHAALPDATFTLVGSAWVEALETLLPFRARAIHVDRIFPPPRRGGEVADVFLVSSAVITYTAAPESAFVDHIRRVCRGPVVVWPVAPAGGIHAARHLANAIVSAPNDLDSLPLPALQCPREVRTHAREWLDRELGQGVRPVAMHPGSGGRQKCWPAYRFAELASHVDAPVLLIEGPADADVCCEFTEALAPSVLVVRVAGVSLPYLAALLVECREYVGNDSGASHLAAALGVPTVAVFGPTDPAVWAPRGPKVIAVAPFADVSWPAVDDVLIARRRLGDDGIPGLGA